MSFICSKIEGLHRLLSELDYPQNQHTSLHAHNTNAIQIAVDLVLHERTEHIEVDFDSI